jgi:hypothetical protein
MENKKTERGLRFPFWLRWGALRNDIVMWQEEINKDTFSFGKFTAMGTAKIIGKEKGVVMATSFGVLPMVFGLDFSACRGCIQRGYKKCGYAPFCPVLAASREKAI